jgi:hypothetical protein
VESAKKIHARHTQCLGLVLGLVPFQGRMKRKLLKRQQELAGSEQRATASLRPYGTQALKEAVGAGRQRAARYCRIKSMCVTGRQQAGSESSAC